MSLQQRSALLQSSLYGERPYFVNEGGEDTHCYPSILDDTVAGSEPVNKYPCPACRKSFTFSSHLERHMLVHTGDRPFPCPHCSYKAGQRAVLKKHIQRIHMAGADVSSILYLADHQGNSSVSVAGLEDEAR